MDTKPEKKEVLLKLNADLVERLKILAKIDHKELNRYIEDLLMDYAYEPNEITKAAMEEAQSRKLKNTTPIDLSSIEAMDKSILGVI